MTEIVPLPTRGVRCSVSPKAIWVQPEPTDRQIWNACSYMNDPLEKCKGCTRGAKTVPMCYLMAAELCRVVAASGYPEDAQ